MTTRGGHRLRWQRTNVLHVVVGLFGLVAAVPPAFAQRADDNVVTQAQDAFGASVGDEEIGIYSADNVRGFSPADAGNIRIEGLYFDQQAFLTDRISNSSIIRVGVSALDYPFPAPTGIADYALRRPGRETIASVGMNVGPYGSKSTEVDVELPLAGDRLGVAIGAGLARDREPFGGTPNFFGLGAVGRFSPSAGVEILPFWGRVSVRDEESEPVIFSSGAFLPKPIKRGPFYGQPWADFSANLVNWGVVAKVDPFGFDIALGIFRSVNNAIADHFDLLFDVDQTGRVGNRLVIAQANGRFASTSGELRIARTFAGNLRRHTLFASIRARNQSRKFGGEDVISLGTSQTGVEDFRSEPVRQFGTKTRDAVRQVTVGLGYQLSWQKRGDITVGIQKTDYRKSTVLPGAQVTDFQSRARPWLFSFTGAIYAGDDVTLYGGYTRGLEESPVAPSEAINLNEAPPAIQTTQKDAGVRWRLSRGVALVIGVFDIAKPYFAVDAASRFRQLGKVRHRGIEFSLAGEIITGVNLVAGTVLLDAQVSGDDVNRGIIGRTPVGTFVRQTSINLDYVLPFHQPLSVNTNFESTSERAANNANTLVVPARWVLGVGARYKFRLGKVPAVLRVNVDNLTNKFGWNVAGSGAFVTNGARRFSLSLAADL